MVSDDGLHSSKRTVISPIHVIKNPTILFEIVCVNGDNVTVKVSLLDGKGEEYLDPNETVLKEGWILNLTNFNIVIEGDIDGE